MMKMSDNLEEFKIKMIIFLIFIISILSISCHTMLVNLPPDADVEKDNGLIFGSVDFSHVAGVVPQWGIVEQKLNIAEMYIKAVDNDTVFGVNLVDNGFFLIELPEGIYEITQFEIIPDAEYNRNKYKVTLEPPAIFQSIDGKAIYIGQLILGKKDYSFENKWKQDCQYFDIRCSREKLNHNILTEWPKQIKISSSNGKATQEKIFRIFDW